MRKLIFLAALLLGGLPLPVLSQGAYPTKGKESKEGKIAALPTRGVLTFGGGARYEGDLVHGKAHGKGVITFPSGDRYEGEFVGNKYQGKGIYNSPSGQRYEGDYVADVRHGKGFLTWPIGQR